MNKIVLDKEQPSQMLIETRIYGEYYLENGVTSCLNTAHGFNTIAQAQAKADDLNNNLSKYGRRWIVKEFK